MQCGCLILSFWHYLFCWINNVVGRNWPQFYLTKIKLSEGQLFRFRSISDNPKSGTVPMVQDERMNCYWWHLCLYFDQIQLKMINTIKLRQDVVARHWQWLHLTIDMFVGTSRPTLGNTDLSTMKINKEHNYYHEIITTILCKNLQYFCCC